jgi:hypothetical protein
MAALSPVLAEPDAALEGGAITTWEQVDWIYREGYKTVLADMRRAGELAVCPCRMCSMHDGLRERGK